MKRMPRKRATRCQMAELVAKKCRSTTGETIVGGHLGRLHFLAVFHVDRGSAAQVGPVNVGAQVFAADGTIRFALNVDSQLFATGAAIGHVAQMPDRCIAAVSKQLPISHVQREKIFFEIHSDMVFTV